MCFCNCLMPIYILTNHHSQRVLFLLFLFWPLLFICIYQKYSYIKKDSIEAGRTCFNNFLAILNPVKRDLVIHRVHLSPHRAVAKKRGGAINKNPAIKRFNSPVRSDKSLPILFVDTSKKRAGEVHLRELIATCG